MRVRRALGLVGLALLGALGVAFVFLPVVARTMVNRELKDIKGYTGHVGDIDFRLLQGNLAVQNLRLVKTGRQAGSPFLALQTLASHVSYADLLKGRLRASLAIEHPTVRLVLGKTQVETQTGAGVEWMKKARGMFPIRIDRIHVCNGEIHLESQRGKVPVRIALTNIEARVSDLTNRDIPATVRIRGDTTGGGRFTATVTILPLRTEPTLDLNFRLEQLRLEAFNEVLRAYGGFDVSQGVFELTAEVSVRNGVMDGYAKPFFKNLELLNWKEDVEQEKEEIRQLFWEGVVSLISELFKNKDKQQVATVIPIHGELEDPGSDLLVIIAEVLRNAFIQALSPALGRKTGG